MKALWLVFALLTVPAMAAPPQAEAARPAQPPHVAALGKLHTEVRRHLVQRGSRTPLPWRDAVVMPDREQLVWHAQVLRWNKGRLMFRVAFDPNTRWYYVVSADRHGDARYYGPIDQLKDGSFVDWRSGAR